MQGSLSDLVESANQIIAETAERRGEHRRLTKAVAEQKDALEKAQISLKSAQDDETAWSKRWAAAMQEISLPADTTAKTAQGYLEELTQL